MRVLDALAHQLVLRGTFLYKRLHLPVLEVAMHLDTHYQWFLLDFVYLSRPRQACGRPIASTFASLQRSIHSAARTKAVSILFATHF